MLNEATRDESVAAESSKSLGNQQKTFLHESRFVDKAKCGGHNEKASLELQPLFCWGFTHCIRARMAELADAQVSEACDLTVVEVRVLFRAPTTFQDI